MVGRIWRGWTTPANAAPYERLLQSEILPGIDQKQLPGYLGAWVLRREVDGEVEFLTILRFDSMEGVRALAGADYERAYVPAKARALLTRFDATSRHYQTVEGPGPGAL